jgi:hypothetical protein
MSHQPSEHIHGQSALASAIGIIRLQNNQASTLAALANLRCDLYPHQIQDRDHLDNVLEKHAQQMAND